MEKFIEILRSKGYKITPQRRAVIDALLSSETFPTAQQVLKVVKKTTPDVSLDTIYRNLNLLIDLHMVNEIKNPKSGGSVFEVVTSQKHHHHFVCLLCGKTECMDVCPINNSYIAEAEKRGFEVTGHTFEFYGKCRGCREVERKK